MITVGLPFGVFWDVGVRVGIGVEELVELGVAVAVEEAVGVAVKIGVKVEVKLGVAVAVAMAMEIRAPFCGKPTGMTAWPLVPARPTILNW